MAHVRSARRSSAKRVWVRPRVVAWLALALAGSCGRSVVAQEDYDRYSYREPQPPARGTRGERGGFFGPMAVAMTSFAVAKFFWSGRRKRKVQRMLEEQQGSWAQMKAQDIAAINEQFSDMERSLTISLDEKHRQAKQLEQFLYSLPDTNQDGLITRSEFDKYMSEYKRTHPELTDLDLPRFEDMDHNNNGHINFHEWEEYQLMAMGANA